MGITKNETAYELGYSAYDTLNIRTLSAAMYQLLEGSPVGADSVSCMKAYYSGWDARATEAADAALLN